VSLSRSGTATSPIDFIAVPSATVTVTGATNGFYTNGKAHVTIQGFTVAGTTEDGIVVSKNSSHITIRGNRVTNAGHPGSGQTARGIRVDIANDNVVADNTVDHNTDYGIYVVGGSTRNEITGNRVFSNARSWQRAASGIRIHSSAGNTISGNISHDNEDSGIELVTGSQNNLVVNNVVYDNGDHGIDDTGNSPNNRVIGNAVYNSVTAGIDFEGGATGSTAFNNIAVDNGINSPRTKGNLRVDSTSTMGTTLDYNIVYLSVPGRNYEWGIGYETLAQMQLSSGQEAHSIQADPKWNSPAAANFTLQSGSPAIDSADSLVAGAAATDAIGTARIDDPPTVNTGVGPRTYDDRGPFEYTPQNHAPSAALTVTPSSGAIDLPVTADASASTDTDGLSPIATYAFDWGDGSAITGPQAPATATHTYRAPGTYTVRVTVTDTANLASEARFTVTVRDDAPVAALSTTPSSGAAPLAVTADASASADTDATPVADYSFDWGDGSAPTGRQTAPTATHIYAASGTYTVTVTVRDSAGQASQATSEILAFGVNIPPTAALEVSPSSGEVNLAVTADASASSDPDDGIVSYTFDFGDGTPVTGSQPTAAHAYRVAGTYTVKATVTDAGGGSSHATRQVTVTDPAPAARLTVSPSSAMAPVDVIADAAASTDSDGTPIASYTFGWGDGSATTGPSPTATATHTYTAAGTYTATVTVRDTAGQASTATAQVAAKPNLVGNAGFETALTGWNTSGSITGATISRVTGGQSGAWSAKLANGSTQSGTCTLNDAPNWVSTTSAGTYNAAVWVRGDSAGAGLKLKITEYRGTTNVGSASTTATLTTSWQKLSLNYTVFAPGSSTLDYNAYIIGAPPGTCFYADDAAIFLT
jgi:parallel beta-helix repeat protein